MRSLDPAAVRRWTTELVERGHTPTPLAAGVEGVVFRLGDGRVAKVWSSRTEVELEALASFYDAVAGARLPFLTPRIHAIGHVRDATFSIERELPGTPLFPDHTGQSPPLDPQRLHCIVTVLAAFAAVTPNDGMKVLPVLDEPDTFGRDGDFNSALGDLVSTRVERSLEHTRAAVPSIDRLAASLAARLSTIDTRPDGLVHGDLIPANILVDDDGEVSAVLDFGFFSTVGSPAFDAAVTAGIFDMYGPDKDSSCEALGQLIREAFGYPQDVLAIYLAAYAMATMTMFGSSADDGHFRWCAEVVRRPVVLSALA